MVHGRSETKLKKMLNQDDGQGHAGMIFWCQSKLARIYPAALRVESTNYDPSEAWAHGCQVVALNVQVSVRDSDPPTANPTDQNCTHAPTYLAGYQPYAPTVTLQTPQGEARGRGALA